MTATEYIMAYMPTPILIVSASTNRGELFKTYDALAAGAVDVLEKPRVDDVDAAWERRFVAAVQVDCEDQGDHPSACALERHGARCPAAVQADPTVAPASKHAVQPHDRRYGLLAFGASTGGPAAIVKVLRALPAGLPVPIFFVLHIDEPFGTAFAEWLDSQTPHPVAYARDREPFEPLRGRVIMAPAGPAFDRRRRGACASVPSRRAIPAAPPSTCCSSLWRRSEAPRCWPAS